MGATQHSTCGVTAHVCLAWFVTSRLKMNTCLAQSTIRREGKKGEWLRSGAHGFDQRKAKQQWQQTCRSCIMMASIHGYPVRPSFHACIQGFESLLASDSPAVALYAFSPSSAI